MRKHADFAMYQVKQTDKGRIAEFDQKAYEEKYRDSQIRKEFHRFVKETGYLLFPAYHIGKNR